MTLLLALSLVIFVTVAVAAFSFAAAAVAPTSTLGSRLQELSGRSAASRPTLPVKERLEQALDPFSRALPLSPAEVSRTRSWLIQAGLRDPRYPTIYFGIRVLFALAGLTGVLAFTGMDSLWLLIGVPAFGFILPRFFLKRMIRARQLNITLALPDALDLTVVCVEAGLPLDQALTRVGDELGPAHPDLSDEFRLFNLEIRAGKPRVEALRNLAQRTGVDDVRSLVATLVQTDRFGTSVSQALRAHSDSLRTERRQRAEEMAAKTAIKMIVPMAIFVLPSVMFVTIGPAVIQLIRTLVPVAGR